MRNNSIASGSTPVGGRLKTNSLNCAVPTRFGCPRCFRGGKTLYTTHAKSRIGPRGTSSTSRFCVIANGGCSRTRLNRVRGRVRKHLGRTVFGHLRARGGSGVVRLCHDNGGRRLTILHSALVNGARLRTRGHGSRAGVPSRLHRACGAVNNIPFLSGRCAICNRIIRKLSMMSTVRRMGAGGRSHPARGMMVGSMRILR